MTFDAGRSTPAGPEAYGHEFFDERPYGSRFNQYYWARRFYANLIKRYRNSGKLLEVGCGLGHVLARLEDRFETYGVDFSDYAIEQARANAPGTTLSVGPADDFAALPGPFDVIAAFHVVEHLADPGAMLEACARVSTRGALLVFATPNPEAPMAKRKGDRWYGIHPTHIALKPPAEWLHLTRRAGYRIVKSFGDGLWDPPYIPLIPKMLQFFMFGWPAAIQTVTGVPFIPVRFGEALLVVAERE